MIKLLIAKIKYFYDEHERGIGIGFMIFGFGVDNLTLKRSDLFFDNLVIVCYLLVALACIIVINMNMDGRSLQPLLQKISHWAPLPMQMAFGGVFSAFTVLYSKSAAFFASWPFIIILFLLMVGNEFFKSRYAKFSFHLTVFYTALLSYTILIIPAVTRRMGAFIFFISGIASLLVTALVLLLLKKLAPDRLEKNKYYLAASITAVFAIFNILYFTNIIPPVPLSLKAIGIYHDLQRNNSGYDALVEPPAWYQFFYDTSRTFHRYNKERVYVFSSVFAPTDLASQVYHRWSKYDDITRKWVAQSTLSYPMVGGRDGGYRGYSYKQNIKPGRWRVDVVTKRNQLIGRITFTIKESSTQPSLKAAKL